MKFKTQSSHCSHSSFPKNIIRNRRSELFQWWNRLWQDKIKIQPTQLMNTPQIIFFHPTTEPYYVNKEQNYSAKKKRENKNWEPYYINKESKTIWQKNKREQKREQKLRTSVILVPRGENKTIVPCRELVIEVQVYNTNNKWPAVYHITRYLINDLCKRATLQLGKWSGHKPKLLEIATEWVCRKLKNCR